MFRPGRRGGMAKMARARKRAHRRHDRKRAQSLNVFAARRRGEEVKTGYVGPLDHLGVVRSGVPATLADIISTEQAKAAPQIHPGRAPKIGGGIAGFVGRALRSLAFMRRSGRES